MRFFAGMLIVLATATASAQSPQETIRRLIAPYPAVQFAAQALEEVPAFGSLSNVTIKPKGDGPFPAVVLVHTCGGIKDAHMAEHAREFLALGYVVTIQDSFGPRGKRDCGPNNAQALVSVVGANDAYAALAHLRQYTFVDPERVFLAGYSWGGMTAQWMGSRGLAEILQSPGRFRAAVANYPPCLNGNGRPFMSAETLDRPVLLLLGGKDTETPASSCLAVVEQLQAVGAPVQVHVFPDATHGWDKRGLGSQGYIYDDAIAKEATRRMVSFFEAQQKSVPAPEAKSR